jgi:glutamyl-tRNA reductase
VPWEEGLGSLGGADIVVSCTGAPHAVLTKKDVARAIRGRRKGPLFLIDIAVPRDIEPAVNELDNVYLYDIDGLQGVVDANLEQRQQAAERAKRMIAGEVAAFDRWRQSQELAPLIVSLRESLLDVGRREVDRFRRRLGALDGEQQAVVEELTRAVIQKILHRPIRHLHHAAERGHVAETKALYREIFGVETAREPAAEAGDETAGPQRILEGGTKG